MAARRARAEVRMCEERSDEPRTGYLTSNADTSRRHVAAADSPTISNVINTPLLCSSLRSSQAKMTKFVSVLKRRCRERRLERVVREAEERKKGAKRAKAIEAERQRLLSERQTRQEVRYRAYLTSTYVANTSVCIVSLLPTSSPLLTLTKLPPTRLASLVAGGKARPGAIRARGESVRGAKRRTERARLRDFHAQHRYFCIGVARVKKKIEKGAIFLALPPARQSCCQLRRHF